MQRRISSKGFNVPAHQHTDVEKMKHETVTIPSNSQIAWGSYFTIDIKEKNVLIHDLLLRVNASAITGLTGATNVRYTPSFFWFSRIELTINNVVIDTIYGNQQFLLNQFFNEDLKRQYINNGAGNYASVSQRTTLASSANDYFIPLWTFFRQTHMPFIHPKDDVQLRLYVDNASNNIAYTGGTGTAASTLNSCQLLVNLSRLGSQSVATIKQALVKAPHDYQFSELRIGTYTVAQGATTTSIILSSLVGPVSYLFFVIRPSGANGDNYFAYQAIKDFAILDSGSTNIVGGQVIPSNLALTVYNRDWLRSSYTAETPNNNVYLYSFSASPSDNACSAKLYNHHNYIGSEQLQLNFPSALASSVTIDVYAQVNAYIKSSATDVKKVTVNFQ
jgi:hypothetical protein